MLLEAGMMLPAMVNLKNEPEERPLSVNLEPRIILALAFFWLMEMEAAALISRLPDIDAPPVKELRAVQVLAKDLEGTPKVPQFRRTKPVEAELEMAKELASKEREVTLVWMPPVEKTSMPGRLPDEEPPVVSWAQENWPVERVHKSLSLVVSEQPSVRVALVKARPV